jgi:Mrp family chromosome partitioning ATPase
VAPVREALDQLLRRNARVLGVVLNEVDASTKSYYYYKYDGYDTSPKRRKEAVK